MVIIRVHNSGASSPHQTVQWFVDDYKHQLRMLRMILLLDKLRHHFSWWDRSKLPFCALYCTKTWHRILRYFELADHRIPGKMVQLVVKTLFTIQLAQKHLNEGRWSLYEFSQRMVLKVFSKLCSMICWWLQNTTWCCVWWFFAPLTSSSSQFSWWDSQPVNCLYNILYKTSARILEEHFKLPITV
jgi:hypothetical protein